MKRWIVRTALPCVLGVALLAGCGGGGGSDGPASDTAAGLYSGQVGSGSTAREFSVLVLDSGRAYGLYTGPAGGAPAYIAGVVIGNGSTSGNTFSAATIRDFNFEGLTVTTGSLTASFSAETSISGTLSFAGVPPVPFSGSYDVDYERTPSLARLAGTYSGQVASSSGVQNGSVTVAADGSVVGTAAGCAVTGTAAPRSGANVYNLSLLFGSGCVFPSGTRLDGHAYLDETTGVLYAITPNGSLTDGILFVGTEP
jgi:hypothetical protein